MVHQKPGRISRPRTPDTTGAPRLYLSVRVTPRASQHQLIRNGDSLEVRVMAAPVDGAANEALIELLAARLSLPKRAVRITAGATSREKMVEIEGLATLAEIWERLGL